MTNWYYKPCFSDEWDKKIDYVMFIDENNCATAIDKVKEKILRNEQINPDENIFTVTGCYFSHENYLTAKKCFSLLRKKFWKDGKYYNEKAKNFQTVCFHSEDIRGRKKAFHKNEISEQNYELFIKELDTTLNKINYHIISININLKNYILYSKYSELNVYKTAFNFIVERFIFNIGNNKGYIIFEARGKKEDRELLEHINKIINYSGTEFIKSKELQKKVLGVFFNEKRNKNDEPYVGLEIADLSSYPIHRYKKYKTIGRDFETIKHKIVGYPNYDGKGLKIYPKK